MSIKNLMPPTTSKAYPGTQKRNRQSTLSLTPFARYLPVTSGLLAQRASNTETAHVITSFISQAQQVRATGDLSVAR